MTDLVRLTKDTEVDGIESFTLLIVDPDQALAGHGYVGDLFRLTSGEVQTTLIALGLTHDESRQMIADARGRHRAG